MLDGGAPFYRTYETSDGGLTAEDVPNQLDASAFPEVHKLFAEKFAGKTRDE
jgi:alpha-methylacyl-CoA racemase